MAYKNIINKLIFIYLSILNLFLINIINIYNTINKSSNPKLKGKKLNFKGGKIKRENRNKYNNIVLNFILYFF